MKQAKYISVYGYLLCVGLFIVGIFGTSQAMTAMAENTLLDNRKCIIIDPGHGGVDGGATSVSGKLESHYNLEIALRLNDLLHLLGYKTQMIRTEEYSIHTSGQTIAAKKVSDLK